MMRNSSLVKNRQRKCQKKDKFFGSLPTTISGIELYFTAHGGMNTHTHILSHTPVYTHNLMIKPPLIFISCFFSLPISSTLMLSMMPAVALCGAPNVYYCWCLQVCLHKNHQPFTTAPTAAKQPQLAVCKTTNNRECYEFPWWRRTFRREAVS